MNNQKARRPGLVYPPCETFGKINHSTEKCYFRANATNTPLPRKRQNQVEQRNAQSNSDWNVQAANQTLN